MLRFAVMSTEFASTVSHGVANTMRPRGNIHQRSPGSFRLRYTLGKDPVTGKRRTATTTLRGTRKDAGSLNGAIDAPAGSHQTLTGLLASAAGTLDRDAARRDPRAPLAKR